MRTIGFRPNVLFIIAAAFGLLASLGRPWYAPAPAATLAETGVGEVQGPSGGVFLQLAREFTAEGGTKGWDVFTSTDTILMGLVAVAVVTAIASLVPGAERPAREALRLVTLAMLGIVVVKLVNTPDAANLVERRQGAWIALGVTGIMASSAMTLYSAPLARRKRTRSLYDTPPVATVERSHAFDGTASVSHHTPTEPY